MTTIRNLEKKDAGQVALLINQLTRYIVEPENLITRIGLLVHQKNSHFLVAELHGKVIGFGGLVWYAIPSKGLIAWVEELVVDVKHRNKGIGKKLVEALLVLAKQKKVTRIKLTATKSANFFYGKWGFIRKNQDYLVKDLTDPLRKDFFAATCNFCSRPRRNSLRRIRQVWNENLTALRQI